MNASINKWVWGLLMLTISLAGNQAAIAQPGFNVPVESFYTELAPYGQWGQHPTYGNVWRPNTGPDFQPYASNGHWVVTEYGNTWVSDYDWGWAPFHYGRWILDPAYGGWIWIPASEWGPAWVSWRSGGGYYGWAPLGPGIDINVNINIPAPYWTFVPQVYITSPNLYSYRVPHPRVINIYQNTTIINNVYRYNNRAYVYGPQRVEIERVTRRPVQVYRVDYMDRPGRSVVGNGSVGFYRPNPSVAYGRNYNNSGRYDNGRGYNRYNEPNREYRPNYAPNDRRGGYGNGNVPAEPRTYNRPTQPDGNDRGWNNRRGNSASDGYSPQPNRTYERPDHQAPVVNSPAPNPGPRAENTYQQPSPDVRGQGYPQRDRSQNQWPGQNRGGEANRAGHSRGPR
ncbi:hypothetical protein GCM10027341_48980 [Spirosoma knui]